MLDRLLEGMTRYGGQFPIPIRIQGCAQLFIGDAQPGTVYCSAHIPLVRVGVGVIMEKVAPNLIAIAAEPDLGEAVALWGKAEGLPAIRKDISVLVKVRTLLRSGKSIVVLADRSEGSAVSDRVMRLVQHLGGKVVFMLTRLNAEGVVDVELFEPPDAACSSEEGILRNVELLFQQVQQIYVESPPKALLSVDA